MDIGPASLSAATLLEHEDFVRAVARGLLGDAHAAEDTVQETWLRTLQGGPRARGALRGWLGSVARNLARDLRRGTARRTLREERVARGEAGESVAAAFERLTVQRDVVAAILELAEPYRSVVLLRYYHDLAPNEIAARLAAKPATVRTQLVRAHELLRQRLDSRYRREQWAALLLPLGVRPEGGGGMKFLLLGVGSVATAMAVWVALPASTTRGSPPAIAAATEPPVETPVVELVPPDGSRQPASNAPSRKQPAAASPQEATETISPRAELLARRKYDDYEYATFSFEFGLRDDPEGIVSNDWDVLYTGDEFDVRTITDDVSLIADLGTARVEDLWALEIGPLEPAETAPVFLGHTYLVWTRDGDSDLVSAFEVIELVPEDRCVLEWYATEDGKTARGSFRDQSTGKVLASKLLALRRSLLVGRPNPGDLRTGHVLLQGRNGAGGGNPFRVGIAGETSYFYERATEPLDVLAPLDMHERGIAYCEGGTVPGNQVFVVTRARYWGTAAGDANGAGGFALVIGRQRVVEHDRPEAISGTWSGRIEVSPGEENDTYLEIRNSSAGEVELFGVLVDRLELSVTPPPKRTGRYPPLPRLGELREPRARLQARSRSHFRVKLDGSISQFRGREERPLDLLAPVKPNETPAAYCDGGVVPAGKVFVVTRVDYWARGGGSKDESDGFKIVIGGQRVAQHARSEPISGTWTGRIEIPRGEETRTYLEVRNSSVGEAILSGEFVDAR